ncbi:dihydrofolate reductase [Paenibacillus xylanexedens]|uniref:dihydrofolate reductase n=1 Tax=Paenibacillus xylanexedens TaxID=528191 RepID=UPI000F5287F8|nr:dihydrofolate reductase [Paenibacillus xylanexedens]RPK20020.1 Dihydrofolate reductase [Paenibacillus xylanexedens]
MKIALIAAIGKNGELGLNGDLPWKIPEDLKYFRTMTEGNVLVMGRKTFESIKKPLRNRTVIVVTTKQNYDIEIPGYQVMNTIGEVMEYCYKNNVSNLYVAGGGEMYKNFLAIADLMYLTRVDAEFEADTYFPIGEIEGGRLWRSVTTLPQTDLNSEYTYRFEVYER